MRRQHRRKPANLAPAHGVGLAGDRKWPHAGLANPASSKVQINNGIALVGATDGLICALAEQSDHFGMGGDQIGKLIEQSPINTRRSRIVRQPVPESGGRVDMIAQIVFVQQSPCHHLGEQGVEQDHVPVERDG